ncbi:DNA polymerase III subunit chi [Desertibaculum subflavum]|uniref:DNA polymerase III subunit chi n=1 Tax=Desertibaculum subflavum TaxID=2268458 RepID=UPI000E66F6BB
MTEVGFYHLLDQRLDDALAQLLEKAHERGMRSLVLTGSEARSEALAGHLWSYSRDNFLPHGTRLDGRADEQPIFLTDREENPNGATALFLVEGGPVEFVGRFERCFDLFDGRDEEAVTAARERWKAAKAAGHKLTYWRRQEAGGWKKEAEA